MAPVHPSCPTPKPHLTHPTPLLRLQIHDLSSPGAHLFLTHLSVSSVLQIALTLVLTRLYPSPQFSSWPGTRSVTLYLEAFDGVAYTTGNPLDNDHKEIHLSSTYISSIALNRVKEEIEGILVHEMVHCWQYNGKGTCPGGLIEGIADFVRLKAGYVPPHWRRETKGKSWDEGYHTTGYFLEWLDDRGHGTAGREWEIGNQRRKERDIGSRMNAALKDKEYNEEVFWQKLCGQSVDELWDAYGKELKREGSSSTFHDEDSSVGSAATPESVSADDSEGGDSTDLAK